MESLYAEVQIQPKKSMISAVIRIILLVIVAAFTLLAIVTTIQTHTLQVIIACFPVIAMVLLGLYYWNKFSQIEYEYIFCDDRIDIARIRAKQSRKNIMRIELEAVEEVIPETTGEFKKYGELPMKDFTSKERQNKVYALIATVKGKRMKVLVEPNEKMLQCLRLKASSKMVREY